MRSLADEEAVAQWRAPRRRLDALQPQARQHQGEFTLGGAFQEDLYLVTLQGVCDLRSKELR